MSCKKSQEFLEAHNLEVVATTDARKQPYDRAATLELARSVARIVVARRKSVDTLNFPEGMNDDILALYLLGPTGNLKAPTLRVGDTLYVGFSEAAYQQLLS